MDKRYLLGIAALLTACANGGIDVYSVYVPQDLPLPLKQHFIDSVEEWQDSVPVAINFRDTPCDDFDSHCANVSTSNTANLTAEYGDGHTTTGWTTHDWWRPQDMFIATDQTPTALYHTVLHEIGHLIGLKHIAPGNAMYCCAIKTPGKVMPGDIAEWYHEHGN